MNGSSLQHQRRDEKLCFARVSLDLRGAQVGTLINNVIVVWLVCIGGRVKKRCTYIIGTCVPFLRFLHLHTHICACACVAYSRPKRSIFRSSLPANGTGVLVSPPSLSCPAVHSAERDICSVRECPNYSWSFNHSGFSLCGICGASHKSVTATLFISDLYFQITLKNTHIHIYIYDITIYEQLS